MKTYHTINSKFVVAFEIKVIIYLVVAALNARLLLELQLSIDLLNSNGITQTVIKWRTGLHEVVKYAWNAFTLRAISAHQTQLR